MFFSRRSTLAVLAFALLSGCGGASGGGTTPTSPGAPAPTASLTGVISDERDATPVASATISVGTVSVTTNSAGEYTIPSAATGNAVVTVTASGFDPYTKSINLRAGNNSMSLLLVRVNTLYKGGGVSLYLPSGVTKFRGVLLTLYGGTVDGRQLLSGDLDYYVQFPLTGDVASYRSLTMAFARKYGFAVMGMVTLDIPRSTAITEGLSTVAALTGHPELAQAPIVVIGNSNGACMAYDLAARAPGRVIGFISTHAFCATVSGVDAEPARDVPGYFVVGDADPQVPSESAAMIRAVFDAGRSAGAPWAFAIEPGGTHAMIDFVLTFDWMGAVVTDRVADSGSPSAPSSLRPVTETAGWLGNLSSFAIAGYSCYASAPSGAAWLPSQKTAGEWQAIVSSHTVTTISVC